MGLSQKIVTLERSPVPGRTDRGEGSHRLILRFFPLVCPTKR